MNYDIVQVTLLPLDGIGWFILRTWSNSRSASLSPPTNEFIICQLSREIEFCIILPIISVASLRQTQQITYITLISVYGSCGFGVYNSIKVMRWSDDLLTSLSGQTRALMTGTVVSWSRIILAFTFLPSPVPAELRRRDSRVIRRTKSSQCALDPFQQSLAGLQTVDGGICGAALRHRNPRLTPFQRRESSRLR